MKVYDREGSFLRRAGGRGSGPGELLVPGGRMGMVKVRRDAILAWPLQATDYPKLYVFELPEL